MKWKTIDMCESNHFVLILKFPLITFKMDRLVSIAIIFLGRLNWNFD